MYKLVNIKTQKETLCQKTQIENFDYYVSDKEIKLNDLITDNYRIWFWRDDCSLLGRKKVIATNNPNIDIPKVRDEVEVMRETLVETYLEKIKDLTKRFFWKAGFKHGYNKSQETYPFSEEDMIEFNEFSIGLLHKQVNGVRYYDYDAKWITTKELLQLWKKQKPKIVYYE